MCLPSPYIKYHLPISLISIFPLVIGRNHKIILKKEDIIKETIDSDFEIELILNHFVN